MAYDLPNHDQTTEANAPSTLLLKDPLYSIKSDYGHGLSLHITPAPQLQYHQHQQIKVSG